MMQKVVPNISWIFISITESAFSKAHLSLMKIIIIPFIPDVETPIQKSSITCPRTQDK